MNVATVRLRPGQKTSYAIFFSASMLREFEPSSSIEFIAFSHGPTFVRSPIKSRCGIARGLNFAITSCCLLLFNSPPSPECVWFEIGPWMTSLTRVASGATFWRAPFLIFLVTRTTMPPPTKGEEDQ